jgi:hypothetical protein
MQSVQEHLLKLLFPKSALGLIFLTLTFLDMIWVHLIHVLGMSGVLGVRNMLWHMLLTCYVALMREFMGAKHDKSKENKAKFRLRIQNCGNIKTIQQF